MIIPLTEADQRCGAKATALRRVAEAGYRVPAAFVVLGGAEAPGDELAGAMSALGPGALAVRSSAFGEDGAMASFAGQFHTRLGVRRDDVLAAVRAVARSGAGEGPAAYAARLNQRAEPAIPVIVQRMVRADAAGVAFTRHPVTGADHVVVEAVTGLGDKLVQGEADPERWVVSGMPRREAGEDRDPVISTAQAGRVAAAARGIERALGGPQDIEWALAAGRIWILQARPLTAAPPAAERPPDGGRLLATGSPASPGVAVGRASVVARLDDLGSFGAGDVLVTRTTSPAWTPLLARAAAVVTETGGLLSHAAIVAREFGVPAVVGVERATSLLARAGRVTVDGRVGSVRAMGDQR